MKAPLVSTTPVVTEGTTVATSPDAATKASAFRNALRALLDGPSAPPPDGPDAPSASHTEAEGDPESPSADGAMDRPRGGTAASDEAEDADHRAAANEPHVAAPAMAEAASVRPTHASLDASAPLAPPPVAPETSAPMCNDEPHAGPTDAPARPIPAATHPTGTPDSTRNLRPTTDEIPVGRDGAPTTVAAAALEHTAPNTASTATDLSTATPAPPVLRPATDGVGPSSEARPHQSAQTVPRTLGGAQPPSAAAARDPLPPTTRGFVTASTTDALLEAVSEPRPGNGARAPDVPGASSIEGGSAATSRPRGAQLPPGALHRPPTAHALGERGREGADPSGAPGDGAPWTAKAAASPRGTPAQVPPAPTFVQTTSKRDAAEHRSDTDRSLPRIDLRFSPRRAAQPTIAPAPTTAPTTHTGPSEAGRPRPRDLVVSPAEDTYASSATSPSSSSNRAAHRPSHRPDVRSSFTAVHVPASHPTGADEVGPPGRSLSTPATQRTSPAAPGRGTGGRGLRGQARADVAAARRDATSDPRAVLRSTNDAGDRSDDDDASSDPVRRGATTPETGATSVRTKVAPTGPAAGSGTLGRSVAALLEPAMDHEGAPVGGPRDGILEAEIDDPDLGRLRVRIRRDDGEVHVRIFVDDPNLRRLADARIADLRATLRQSSGTEVTVDVAADGDRRNRDTDTDDPVRRPPVPATLPSAPAPASPSPGATGGADPRRMVDAIV